MIRLALPHLWPLRRKHQIVGFYCLGFFDEAAELGFSLYDTRDRHPKSVCLLVLSKVCLDLDGPSHRHVRYGLFFHSLAMISSMRKRNVTEETRIRYLKQIELNQRFIKKYIPLRLPSARHPYFFHQVVVSESSEHQHMGSSCGTSNIISLPWRCLIEFLSRMPSCLHC